MIPVDPDVEALRAALEGVASALQSASPDAVLAAEPRLAAAVAALARTRAAGGSIAHPARLRASLVAGRHALALCRALGRSAEGLHAAMFPGLTSYGRAGQLQCAPAVRGTMESRS